MEDVQTICFLTFYIWTFVSFKQEVESVVSGFVTEDSIALPWRGTV